MVLRVEEITDRWLDFLIEFEHLNDIGLVSIAWASFMTRTARLLAILVLAKEIVLCLICIMRPMVLPLFLVAARDPIFINGSSHRSMSVWPS